jgi:hypothetical protein
VLSNLHKTDRIVARSRSLRERNVWFCLHGVFPHHIWATAPALTAG